MNKVEFQQTGGFPIETDTLSYLQDSIFSLQSLAAIAGDNFILSGAVVTGGNVSDGYVVINGEVLPFRGGALQTKVVIAEEVAKRPFENGTEKPVFRTRYVRFGTGENTTLFADLPRIKDLKTFRNLPSEASSAIDSASENTLATSKAVKILNDKVDALIKPGMIMIWSGSISDIPQGWALYEALRDKFVLGAGLSYAVGDNGGTKEEKLTIEQMPRHKHNPASPMGKGDGLAGSGGLSVSRIWGDKFGDYKNEFTDYQGGDQPHNNMPPYYSLAYIIKL